MDTLPPPIMTAPDTGQVAELGVRLVQNIDAVIAGKHDVAEVAIATVLSGGHLLIEDIPGVGKTLLPQVIARSVVFDELNRATPRTQSALLEAAAEATLTVDGVVQRLPDPFMIVATQNPTDIAGTYGRASDGAVHLVHDADDAARWSATAAQMQTERDRDDAATSRDGRRLDIVFQPIRLRPTATKPPTPITGPIRWTAAAAAFASTAMLMARSTGPPHRWRWCSPSW